MNKESKTQSKLDWIEMLLEEILQCGKKDITYLVDIVKDLEKNNNIYFCDIMEDIRLNESELNYNVLMRHIYLSMIKAAITDLELDGIIDENNFFIYTNYLDSRLSLNKDGLDKKTIKEITEYFDKHFGEII